MSWLRINRALYRLYSVARHGRALRRGDRLWRDAAPEPSAATGELPLLYVSWGRIGDTVLATGITRHLSTWFGRPVVMVGRAELRPLVEDHVDTFLPFHADRWASDARYREAFARDVVAEYACVLGDIHLFHGGFWLNGLIDRVPAPHKFVYEGYAGAGLAPVRVPPRTATVVPSLRKDDSIASRHVWHDLVHYLSEVLARVNGTVPEMGEGTHPHIGTDAAAGDRVLAEHGLERGAYVACQPYTNNVKKDVARATWLRVFDSEPDRTFVLLGSAQDAARAGPWERPNVRDLCGRTDLAAAMHIAAGARLFVGPDSGLTHVAACLGRETVCVTQSANLGYFFPYPEAFGAAHLHVVHNPEYEACSGCLMTCSREAIWRTYTRGSLCLRTLPAEAVVDAVRGRLAVDSGEPDAA